MTTAPTPPGRRADVRGIRGAATPAPDDAVRCEDRYDREGVGAA